MNTPQKSGALTAMRVAPYRSEPKQAPALSDGLCQFCGSDLPEGRARYCSASCERGWNSFITALGRQIAPHALVVRKQRPRRKGQAGGPEYSKSQAAIRDLADEALTRLMDARRAAKRKGGAQ